MEHNKKRQACPVKLWKNQGFEGYSSGCIRRQNGVEYPKGYASQKSHSRTVRSSLPLPNKLPSELKATDQMQLSSPVSTLIHCPLVTSHIRIVLSALPLARRVPSGWKATLQISSQCPSSILRHFPLVISHIRILRSILALAIVNPSGLKATALTSLVWPS